MKWFILMASCLISMCWTAGCAEEDLSPEVWLFVLVTDPIGTPLAGTSILIDEKSVGVTDASGRLKIALSGPDGRRYAVRPVCGEGYSAQVDQTREITCRFLSQLKNGKEIYVPLTATLMCRPKRQSFVLLVKTNGQPGLTVNAQGAKVAMTDEDGATQTVLEGTPGEEIEIVLDTTSLPDLRPAMPSRRLRVPDRKQILIFDQKFKVETPKKKRARIRRQVAGPKRIL